MNAGPRVICRTNKCGTFALRIKVSNATKSINLDLRRQASNITSDCFVLFHLNVCQATLVHHLKELALDVCSSGLVKKLFDTRISSRSTRSLPFWIFVLA